MATKKRIRLKVASPCNANWDDMTGDDAIRFCGLCKKNVYQISNMSTDQVEELLGASGEKKCVRFYERKDGTLVTDNCSVGLRRKRRKQAVVVAGAGLLSAVGVAFASPGAPPASSNLTPPTVPAIVEPVIVEPVIVEPVIEPPVEQMWMGESIMEIEEVEDEEEEVAPEPYRHRMGKPMRAPAFDDQGEE